MKIRTDFVTNSSSSSFIIAKKNLDEDQIRAIKDHKYLGEELGIPYSLSDSWNIEENKEYICGSTIIDNFDMCSFLHKIDIPAENIKWVYFDADLDWFMSHNFKSYFENAYEDEEDEEIQDWRSYL